MFHKHWKLCEELPDIIRDIDASPDTTKATPTSDCPIREPPPKILPKKRKETDTMKIIYVLEYEIFLDAKSSA